QLMVTGAGAGRVLDAAVTANVSGLEEWRARYGLVLTEEGGVIDDLFVYRRPDGYLVVPNAANTDAVLSVLRSVAADTDRASEVAIVDARGRSAILALQGRDARPIADALLPGANDLALHRFADMDLDGATIQVARTGYTGEYGFELFVPAADAEAVWNRLMAAGEPYGILPIGLGARDTLRLEMGYPLHGHELSVDINPVEAAMSWAVDWTKPGFRGKAAAEKVRAEGPARKLVGLAVEGAGIPRASQEIHTADPGGAAVGVVTSGNFSPSLKRGIALGFVAASVAAPGTMLTVDVRGKRVPVFVTRPPFVPRGRAAAS
ncbi:MAG TPA: glycine cleavage T C-terminal barrel domain-containing protein, partial [Actinomycetota bacterium]|nr:glycine cleavage T C-terminal barrel domain-containing protein [Actinomycetota bacterium]